MELKPGVSLEGCVWQIWAGAIKAEKVMNMHGYRMIITSGSDGTHMIGSLHKRVEEGEVVGRAIDWRSWIVKSRQEKLDIVEEIKTSLGDDYDVIWEEDDPEHFHMEYQPKEVA